MKIQNSGSNRKTEKKNCRIIYKWLVGMSQKLFMAGTNVIITGNFQGLSGYLISIWKSLKLHKTYNKIDKEQNTKTEPW